MNDWSKIQIFNETLALKKSHMVQWYISQNKGSEWVIKFNGLSWTADSEVHIVHVSCVILAYKLK